MPRSNNISIQNNFIQGLITEATELTFPENACIDTDNCVFENPGVVSRRLGFDFEDQHEPFTHGTLTGQAITTFLWKNAGGEGDINFQVVQIGNTLYFYRVGSDQSLSGSKHATTIDLLDFTPTLVTDVKTLECQYSFGNGVLFVTNENLDSFYVEYDPDGDDFTATQIDIKVRDLEGDPDDPYEVGERPTSTLAALSAFHRYNLENQGWDGTTLAAWDTARSDMPSNADVPWYFKSSGAFDFSTVANYTAANSKAPRGHFIYSLYNIERSSNVSGATDSTIATARVTQSAFFAGRVFYAGLKSTGYSSRIWFSQTVEHKSQYGLCHSINDPTSEQLFDALPTDGGTIDLIEAGTIIKMFPVLNSLVVFCSNGVWGITGSQGTGFTANDYTVYKISSVPSVSSSSFVDVEGSPFWWTLEGIYTLTMDPQTNALRVVPISDTTIKTFFDEVPLESRRYVVGSYNGNNRVIQWLYRATAPAGFTERYEYNSILNFNLITRAFYPWTISTTNVKLHGVTSVTGLSSNFEEFNVINGSDTVVNGSDTVVAFIAGSEDVGVFLKYLVSYQDGSDTNVSWADNINTSHKDWVDFDGAGESYSSFFVTGYSIKGQGMKRFQANYVTMFHDTSETSQFKIRGQWNFTRTGDSGKWSTSQNVTCTEGDRPRRIKMRGHGTVCQFRVDNYQDEPFRLVGWAAFETGNQWI